MSGQRQAVNGNCSLVLHNADPAGPLSTARTQPYVILFAETNFDREVRPKAMRVGKLVVEHAPQITETRLGVLVGYRPFSGILRILDRVSVYREYQPIALLTRQSTL
jgi:hypothetical protein